MPQAVDELSDWDGQSPPTPKHQRGKVIPPKIKDVVGKVMYKAAIFTSSNFHLIQSLPSFGPYLKEKEELIGNYKKTIEVLEEHQLDNSRPVYKPSKPVPSVKVSLNTPSLLLFMLECFTGYDWKGIAKDRSLQ